MDCEVAIGEDGRFTEDQEKIMRDEIKKMLRAAPFRPFTIVTCDGQQVLVTHPENARLKEYWVFVFTQRGAMAELIQLKDVAQIFPGTVAASE